MKLLDSQLDSRPKAAATGMMIPRLAPEVEQAVLDNSAIDFFEELQFDIEWALFTDQQIAASPRS